MRYEYQNPTKCESCGDPSPDLKLGMWNKVSMCPDCFEADCKIWTRRRTVNLWRQEDIARRLTTHE